MAWRRNRLLRSKREGKSDRRSVNEESFRE
jgi:hypothetical protein